MFSPGDVISFYSVEAGKQKHHVCIDVGGKYLFLNSPKKKIYPTDFKFPCSKMPFIDPTNTGESIISCSLPMEFSDLELKRLRAQKKGSLPKDVFKSLVKYIEDNPVLSDEEKDELIGGLADWF